MTSEFPWYKPEFKFDDGNYLLMGPSQRTVTKDLALAFARDIDGKIRTALIEMGWTPPEPFPQPGCRDGEPWCGECHPQRPGEVCDICGAVNG